MKPYSIFAAAALLLAGCATPAPQTTDIDGIQVWKHGQPSQPFKVIDTVVRQAPDTSMDYAMMERSIAREAARRGANAVIIESEVMTVSRMSLVDGRQIMAPKVTAELISTGH
ncbi:MAG TPA: hypothetical protein VHY22_14455 [Chthoniobacteraceae bacterium]|jgi:PBP1b-binding outer membrane lipoprotein LpoB|nr:hypothetical protein [Chthoniobacteraceae bacterium]